MFSSDVYVLILMVSLKEVSYGCTCMYRRVGIHGMSVLEKVSNIVLLPPHREKPLSFYVFTASGATFKRINQLTSAGAVVHNDVLMHASGQHDLTSAHSSLYIYQILFSLSIYSGTS